MNKKRCSFEHREVGAREGLKIGADADGTRKAQNQKENRELGILF